MNRPRGSDGRFVTIRPQNAETARRNERQRVSTERSAAEAESLFSDLLSVVMLNGSSTEAISASAGHGPIAYLAENLLKRKFLLSRYTRSCRIRQFYYAGATQSSRRQDQLPTMSVSVSVGRDSSKVLQRPVFKNRRLPRLGGRSRETRKVWEWIDKAISMKALKFEERNEAFKVFQKGIDMHKDILTSLKFPSRNRSSDSADNSTVDESNSVEIAPVQEVRSVEPRSSRRTAELVQDEEITHPVFDVDNDSGPISQNNLGSSDIAGVSQRDIEREENHSIQINGVLETAKDDKLFFFLCELDRADETRCLRLACAGSLFLKELREKGMKCKPVLEDALQFAIARYFGPRDAQAHRARLKRTKRNVEILKAVRSMLELKPFEEMSWDGVMPVTRNSNRDRISRRTT